MVRVKRKCECMCISMDSFLLWKESLITENTKQKNAYDSLEIWTRLWLELRAFLIRGLKEVMCWRFGIPTVRSDVQILQIRPKT